MKFLLHGYMDTFTFILVISAAMLHATWNFFTKKTKGDRLTMLWLGQLAVGFVTLPLTYYLSDFGGITKEFIFYIILTGVIHSCYLTLLGWSYKAGEVSIVYPVSRGTGIIGTSLLAIILGIDTISFVGFIGILVLISGILSIAISKSVTRNEVIFSASMVGISISLYSVVDKLAVQFIPSLLYGSIMFISTALILSPFIIIKRKPQLLNTLKRYKLPSFIINVSMFSTYSIILFAFRNSPASYVVALREVSIIIATLLGTFFLKEEVTKNKVCGISLIMLGAAVIKYA
ncbi:EamA family transporter [Holosporaceae bacterium 'Namur']|nr:EamA family transporter [Holosporaceae bacterium 'Namur']